MIYDLKSKVQVIDAEGNFKKQTVSVGLKRGDLVLVPSGEPMLIQSKIPTFMRLWNQDTRTEEIKPIPEGLTPCFEINQEAYEYALNLIK